MAEEEEGKQEVFAPYLLIQTEALNSVLRKTNDFFYRKVCRWYSITFHTPLHLVYSMPYDEILLNYYEYGYEKLPYNEVLRLAEETLPELAQKKKKEDEEFIRALMEAEANKKQSLTKSSNVKGKTSKTGEPPQNPPQEIFKTFDVDDDDNLT